MRKVAYSLIVFASMLFIVSSCNESEIDLETNELQEFMPMAVSNYWVYDANSSLNGMSQDSLYISGTTNTNGFNYFDFDASAASTGLATQLYAQNLHRKSNADHLIYGSINLGDLFNDIFDFEIVLNDVVLLNETAAVGTVLATQSDTASQTLDGIPLTIDYTLQNTLNNRTSSLTVNSETFSDIIETEITLNIKITAQVTVAGVTLPITVLEPQDVLVMINSYANEVGLIKSITEISYELVTLPGITYPFPSSGSETSIQEIIRYNVNN
ncbi:MAG: hypothetical protein COA67_00210 [Lutibacter sp.]|nr:MAG: hypothetical protein COA67_00210 [Lutibacter sp.]